MPWATARLPSRTDGRTDDLDRPIMVTIAVSSSMPTPSFVVEGDGSEQPSQALSLRNAGDDQLRDDAEARREFTASRRSCNPVSPPVIIVAEKAEAPAEVPANAPPATRFL